MKRFTLTAALAIAISTFTFGQKMTVDITSSKVEVSGTSTLHDWTEKAEVFEGSGEFNIQDGRPATIKNVSFSVKSGSLKSGKSGMDKNTYAAIKEAEHPNITFGNGTVMLKDGKGSMRGNLTIAGKQKGVAIPVHVVKEGNNIKVKGSYKMKMTDFGIEPPTAVMGTINTGDEVVVTFDLSLK